MSPKIHSFKEGSSSLNIDVPSKATTMETRESEHDNINVPFDTTKSSEIQSLASPHL